jgi:hypothetical protein
MIEPRGTTYNRRYHEFAECAIGDEDLTSRFAPCIDVLAFGRECRGRLYLPKGLSDSRVNDRAIQPVVTDTQIDWWDSVANLGLRFLDAPLRHPITGFRRSYERGAAEVEIIVGAEPPGRVLEMPFELTGLRAFHQPALTAQEITEGATRPDHIVNSYAAYHATKRSMHRAADAPKYKTGKAFHLERATYRDNLGAVGWIMQLLIPPVAGVHNGLMRFPGFPAGLSYPVWIGPTFGNTNVGASGLNCENVVLASKAVLTEDGTVTQMSTHQTNSTAAKDTGTAIYAYTSDTDAGALIKASDTVNVGADTADWVDFALSQVLTAASYFVAVLSAAAGGTNLCAFDAGGLELRQTGQTYPTWPDPFEESATGTRLYSNFATYTAGNPWYQYMQERLAAQ